MADELIFDGDELEELFIPLSINPKKTVRNGALDFWGQPVTLGVSKYCHNRNHLKRLLVMGYEVVTSHTLEIDKQTYLYIVLFRSG